MGDVKSKFFTNNNMPAAAKSEVQLFLKIFIILSPAPQTALESNLNPVSYFWVFPVEFLHRYYNKFYNIVLKNHFYFNYQAFLVLCSKTDSHINYKLKPQTNFQGLV